MATTKQVFAAAVSHGLDRASCGTWHPDLPRTPRVLVPIQLDALVVRTAGGAWADCRMRIPAAANSRRSSRLAAAPPFAELAAAARRAACICTGRLPDALTRGVGIGAGADDATAAERDAANKCSFRRSPIAGWCCASAGHAPRQHRCRGAPCTGWVIEARRPTPIVTPLRDWTEPGPTVRRATTGGEAGNRPRKPLTALGTRRSRVVRVFRQRRKSARRSTIRSAASPKARSRTSSAAGTPIRRRDVLGDGITSLPQFEAAHRRAGLGSAAGFVADRRSTRVEPHSHVVATSACQTREAMAVRDRRDRGSARPRRARLDGKRTLDFEGIAQAAPVDSRQATPIGGYSPDRRRRGGRSTRCCTAASSASAGPASTFRGAARTARRRGRRAARGEQGSRRDRPHADRRARGHARGEQSNRPTKRAARERAARRADELDEPDAAARVDVRVHAASFGALPGGERHRVIHQVPPEPPPGPPNDPSKVDPGIVQDQIPTQPGGTVEGGRRWTRRRACSTSAFSESAKTVAWTTCAWCQGTHVRRARCGWSGGQGNRRAGTRRGEAESRSRSSGALPRFFVPADPGVPLQGCDRSYKHGATAVSPRRTKLSAA